MNRPPSTPIIWRGVTLEPHGPSIWLSSDRLWKLTTIPAESHWVAYLQLEPEHLLVEAGDTPEQALELLLVRATEFAATLETALGQTRLSV